MDQQTLQSFQSQLNNVTSVLIVTRPNPTFDAVAASVSMALSMEKMQKKVSIFCPSPLTVEFGNLIGINQVKQQVGNKNLVVKIKGYMKAGVDKVSYNVEGEDFNLIVVPKPGSPAFDPSNISYSFSGVDSELVILIGVGSLQELGEFYTREKDFFDKVPLANIDSDMKNTNYATYNLTNQAASSCVEIAGYLLQYLKYQVDSDIATNIFYGLMKATNSLSEQKVRAETYELVGMMLRMGARRVQVMQFLGAQVLSPENQIPNLQTVPVQPVNQYSGTQAQQVPVAQPTQPTAQPANNTVNPPDDWTQPKIYKGGSLG